MATSGEVSFTMTATEIITSALTKLRMIAPGDTPEPEDFDNAKKNLNAILRAMMATSLHSYLETSGTLFLTANQSTYIIGGSGPSRTGRDVVTTQLSADEAVGQTVLSIDSNSGINDADVIGIQLDDDTIQWTTVVSSTATTVTITDALTDDASEDNYIFAYTKTVDKPTKIFNARIRIADDSTVPMTDISNDEYDYYADVKSGSTPYNFTIENQRDFVRMKVTPPPNSELMMVQFKYQRVIETVILGTEEIDIPPEYNLGVIYLLIFYIADDLGKTDALGDPNDSKSLAGKAAGAQAQLLAADTDRDGVSFCPGYGDR